MNAILIIIFAIFVYVSIYSREILYDVVGLVDQNKTNEEREKISERYFVHLVVCLWAVFDLMLIIHISIRYWQ